MNISEIMIWIGLAVVILEFIPRLIPDGRVKGISGYLLDFLSQLLLLLKKVSDYLNREDKSLQDQYKKL